MPEKVGVLFTAKKPEDIEYNAGLSLMAIKNKIHWNPDAFSKSDFPKIAALMAKTKKPAEFCISLDSGKLRYFVRTGSDRIVNEEELLMSIKGSENRLTILNGLKGYGVVSDADIAAYKERDPGD
jgi:hypothetical protein